MSQTEPAVVTWHYNVYGRIFLPNGLSAQLQCLVFATKRLQGDDESHQNERKTF